MERAFREYIAKDGALFSLLHSIFIILLTVATVAMLVIVRPAGLVSFLVIRKNEENICKIGRLATAITAFLYGIKVTKNGDVEGKRMELGFCQIL